MFSVVIADPLESITLSLIFRLAVLPVFDDTNDIYIFCTFLLRKV